MRQENSVEKILEKTTPSPKAHAAYLDQVKWFHREFNDLSTVLPMDKVQIKSLRLVKSKLFNREYLVALADRSWLQKIAPRTDAIATDSMTFIDLVLPPVVLVPNFKSLPVTRKFRSILEHEFVHINQAILGRFHKGFGGSAPNLLDALVKYTFCEYEANLIQLSHFPKVFRPPIPINEWATLRGYTQALEGLIRNHIYSTDNKPETMLECFNLLEKALPEKFGEVGLCEATARDYVEKLPQFLLTAVKVIMESDPSVQQNSRFIDLARSMKTIILRLSPID